MVSFSFYDEQIDNYIYQIRTGTSLGNFITATYRVLNSSQSSNYYMQDVRTYYYDSELGEWVFNVADTRGTRAIGFLGLKGSINTIVYSTRDIYTDFKTLGYNRNCRFLLSGRFRNENPFDEFFQEEHLEQLGYEEGDDILRLKYAEDNHALFVIKDSTSPLVSGFLSSPSDYCKLTPTGTLKGLEYKAGAYTEVSTLNYVKSIHLPFDDYVLYSTLDITYQGRLMRAKDCYITGTRDEFVSILPESIQIKEPFEFEVQTNPVGLEVNPVTNLPETYEKVGLGVAQFRAGNSYPYEYYFEMIDLVGEWARQPLPPKQTIAQFYDGNNCRIVYQSGEKECQMLTFTMEEDCHVYWGDRSYGYWYFTDKNKASNFMLYPLTKEGIGEGTSITWYDTSSSYKYLKGMEMKKPLLQTDPR